jgi:hypothetical protein
MSRIMTRQCARRGLCLALVLLANVCTGWSQSSAEHDHFQIKIGASYDRGDFGTAETTKVLYAPITLRYLGERFDLSVTPSFARVNTTGGVRLIDGVPTPTGERPSTVRNENSGAGDTVLRGRFYLLQSESASITPFAKWKIPTAPDNLGLGTGKADLGFGVEADKQIDRYLVFGDFSYTLTGKPQGLALRNRAGGSFGLGRSFSKDLLVSGMLDWRQSVVVGNKNPAELVGILTYRLSRKVTLSPNVYAGLNDSSPDLGFGVELAFRFSRHH